jgi:hypothetical protein
VDFHPRGRLAVPWVLVVTARCDVCLRELPRDTLLRRARRHQDCADAYMRDPDHYNRRAVALGLDPELDAAYQAIRPRVLVNTVVPPRQAAPSAPVLPSAPMPRGGARPGAGRKRRDPSGPTKARPGVPMTDAEWADVVAWAEREGVTNAEACRRLIALGLKASES